MDQPRVKYVWWMVLGAGLTWYPTIYLKAKLRRYEAKLGLLVAYRHELFHWYSQRKYVEKYGKKGVRKWMRRWLWELLIRFSVEKISFEQEAYAHEKDPAFKPE